MFSGTDSDNVQSLASSFDRTYHIRQNISAELDVSF